MRIMYIYIYTNTLRMIITNIKRLCQMHIVADSTAKKKKKVLSLNFGLLYYFNVSDKTKTIVNHYRSLIRYYYIPGI